MSARTYHVPVRLSNMDLDLIDRCAARRQYRILRIGGCGYGMNRDEARKFIHDYYIEVSWLSYLGSK